MTATEAFPPLTISVPAGALSLAEAERLVDAVDAALARVAEQAELHTVIWSKSHESQRALWRWSVLREHCGIARAALTSWRSHAERELAALEARVGSTVLDAAPWDSNLDNPQRRQEAS